MPLLAAYATWGWISAVLAPISNSIRTILPWRLGGVVDRLVDVGVGDVAPLEGAAAGARRPGDRERDAVAGRARASR